jgi:hypothetical protein
MNQNQPWSNQNRVMLPSSRPGVRRAFREVAEQRGARVFAVAPLGVEMVRQQGVATACVDDEARPPRGCDLAFADDPHDRASVRAFDCVQVDTGHAVAFERARAALGCIAKQQLVELRAPDMHGVRKRLVHRFGERETAGVIVPRRHEFGPMLRDADGLDFIAQVQPIE